jgi:hypothetical protein
VFYDPLQIDEAVLSLYTFTEQSNRCCT